MSHGCYIVGYVYVNADFNVNCFEHEKEIIYLYPLTKFQAKLHNFFKPIFSLEHHAFYFNASH